LCFVLKRFVFYGLLRFRQSPRSDGLRTPGSFQNPESEAAIFTYNVSIWRQSSSAWLERRLELDQLLDDGMCMCAISIVCHWPPSHSLRWTMSWSWWWSGAGLKFLKGVYITDCANLFNWEPASKDRSCFRRENCHYFRQNYDFAYFAQDEKLYKHKNFRPKRINILSIKYQQVANQTPWLW